MKILMISPTPFFADRGCHQRILEQSRALKRLGHKIIIATYPIGKDIKGLDIRRSVRIPFYKKTGVGTSGKFPFDPKLILDILLLFKVVKIIRKERPDIVHAHLHEGCFIGFFAKVFALDFKTPLLFDLQGSLTGELVTYGFIKEGSFGYKIFNRLEWLIDRMPNFIVGSSQASIDYAVKRVGINKDKAVEVRDGVSPQILSTKYYEKDKNWLRSKHGITKKEKVIVYTGALTESKGINYLLKAIPKVIEKIPDAFFLICGYPGVERAKIMLAEEGVDKNVLMPGGIPYDLLGLYISLGDVSVDPKTGRGKEASGKILNYMGAAVPVVCFDTPNNKSFLGELGIYAKDGNVSDLAIRLVEALEMTDKERRELGRKLRGRVEEKFSWDSVAKQLDEIYQRII